jgi:hypothetical protein
MPFQEDYPFFSISGVMMDLKFSIGNYVKTRPASIHYATFCSGNSFHTRQVMGAVGLSINDSNYNNIVTDGDRYSIFLKDDGTAGELIFGEDLTHKATDWNLTVGASYDWELKVYGILFGDSPHRHDIMHNAIFDLTSPFIGLPAKLYKEILWQLQERYLLFCQKDAIMPECVFPDDIKFLPNLTLGFVGAKYLDLGPNLYLEKIRDNRYKLLLVGLAIDPHKRGLIHVTPNYADYVILGHPFMKKFYTVFNYQNLLNPVITLYEAK